jgi:hypothetical protein
MEPELIETLENYSYDSQAAPSRWDQLAAARSHAVRVGGSVVNLHWSTGRGEYTVHADRAAAVAALDSCVGPAVSGSMGEHGTRVREDYVDLTPDGCSDSYVRIIASPYISTYAGARQGDNPGISATVHVLNTGCAGKREALALAAAWARGPEAAHLANWKGAGLVRVALESTQYAGEVFCTTGEGRGYVDDPDDLPPGWHMRHGWY